MMGFVREAVEAVGDDWATVEQFNEVLARLAHQRQPSIAPNGIFLKSKLAWKIAAVQQAMLYRIVMLADGCSSAWNARNILTSILSARAIMESAAVFLDFRTQLLRFTDAGNLDKIDALVINRTFGTKLEGWLSADRAELAVNVQTMLAKLDKTIKGISGHYDRLSEICHPNYMGTYMMFADLDTSNGVVTFSDKKLFTSGIFHHVFTAFLLIGLVENAADAIDSLLPRIADLQA
jgi:hypothetical protein